MSALPKLLRSPPGRKSGNSPADLRDSQRRSFIATIELFDLERGGSVLSGRTSDLSSGGCYVDCMNVVPLNTQYRVRIQHGGKILEAVGTVAYASGSNGFGISFVYVGPQDLRTLNEWLCDLRGEAAPPLAPIEQAGGLQFQRGEREILTDLVSLLLKRGVLPVGDGNRLLRELAAYCDSRR